ncbi:MAG: CotH kinase family protein [bacterium]|nr:CotH kinase family protein [bacterium]
MHPERTVDVKIAALSLVMAGLVTLFIAGFRMFGTGVVTVYGDEYVTRYFQRDEVMDIRIEMSEADWAYMIENARQEEFRIATVTVNGDVYPFVKIRPKGNSSLMTVARSGGNRYSFKLNFNGLIENQTLAGLTQLNLNNGFSDPSYMREYLSYQIFEEMGVAVPAFAPAAVYVNGEYFGLYLAVESILEPYLERNFGDLTGDLYKSVGNTLKYNGTDPAGYSSLEVKSTLKKADWSKLTRMLDALNNGGDIERYLDVDAALRYIAVSTALVNFDSYQGNFAHNYYLYERSGVFTILPWDLNMAFGGFGFNGDAQSVYIDEPTQGPLADRPLIAELLKDERRLETYHAYLEWVATEYLSGGYLEAETARLFELISEYVRTDPTAFYTYEQFVMSISGTVAGGAMGDADQAGVLPQLPGVAAQPGRQGFQIGGVPGLGGNVPGLLELAAAMSTSIHRQLSGELPSTNAGSGMGMAGGRVPNLGGGGPLAPQLPRGDAVRPPGEGAGRQPGAVLPPGPLPGGRGEPAPGIRPGEEPGLTATGEGNSAAPLLAWGLVMTAGVILAASFKGRRHVAAGGP